MSSSDFQSDSEDIERRFREAIAPTRSALLDLVDRTRAVREARGNLPAHDAPAMAEIAQESSLSGAWGDTPVLEAYGISRLMVNAAEDMILSLCRLYEVGVPPIYGHTVLARAVVESCSRAAWLAQLGIGARLRVARSMSERLYSIDQAGKLPGAPSDHGLDRRQEILDEADRQGFKKKSGRRQSVVSLDEWRPTNTEAIRRLFDSDLEFGPLLYGYYSAVTHATLYGLTKPLDTDVPQRRGLTPGTVTAGMAATSLDANNVLRCAGLAYVQALWRHRELFGWSDPTWDSAILGLVRSTHQGGPPAPPS